MRRVLLIAANLLFGICCSFPAVLLSAYAFGAGPCAKTFLLGIPAAAVTALLLKFGDRLPRTVRRIAAVCGFPLTAVLSIRFGLYDSVYAGINPEYVREFGGPNQVDFMGLFFYYLPLAFLVLLAGIMLAKIMNGEFEEEAA